MKPTKIHNVLFYKPIPEAINCMSLNKTNLKLAVARSNFSIEIWNLQNAPHIERVIPSIPNNDSIEGLTWCGVRLFSVGLHGFLIEYDLLQLSKKESVSVAGEQAYCLDANPDATKIAVGTEKGYINVFAVEENVLFDKFLDKQEGRIICLKYDSTGNFIISGGEDVIRVWDVTTGHALHKMTTGRAQKDKITIIWCLQVLSDLTIVSGDSRGVLTFWDGKMGAQLNSYRSHKTHILSLCVSDDEKSLYCAGVDPTIICYVVANIRGSDHKWIKSIQRKVHEHDVKSLVLCGSKLYSGGVDAYLTCTYYPPNTTIKFPPLLNNCAKVCSKVKYLVLCYGNYLEVWMLGKQIEKYTSDNIHEPLPLEVKPKQLLILKRTVKNEEDREIKEGIICYSMSHDGKWIVFSTDSITRLWQFSYNTKKGAKIFHVMNLPVAVQCYFSANDSQLVLALRTGELEVYNLLDASLQQTIETSSMFEDTVTFMTGSNCSSYLIVGDCKHNLVVWKLQESRWKKYWKLPKHHCSTVTIAIKPISNNLVCVYSNNEVFEYDLKLKSITPFSKILRRESTKFFSNKLITLRNITFDPERDNVFLMHDDSNLYIIDPNKVSSTQSAKHSKLDSSTDIQSSQEGRICNVINKFKHNAYTQWLGSEEGLVVVQVDGLTLAQQLPPSKKWKKFGTM